ncbi:MAG: hypothetical protein AB1448_11220 [Pseudomonadota bacterium]
MTTEQACPVCDEETFASVLHSSVAHDVLLGEILTYLARIDPDHFEERRRGAAARVQAAHDGRTEHPDLDHPIAVAGFMLLDRALERVGRPYVGAAIIPLAPTVAH